MKIQLIAAAVLAVMTAPVFAGRPEALRAGGALAYGGARALEAFSPAPVPAPEAVKPARRSCRPFLLETRTGGVDETVVIERACSAQNEPYWLLSVELRGAPGVAAKVSSARHPGLEARIKAMALNGLGDSDADLVVLKIGPLLKAAAAAAPEVREELLSAAEELLAAHLSRP